MNQGRGIWMDEGEGAREGVEAEGGGGGAEAEEGAAAAARDDDGGSGALSASRSLSAASGSSSPLLAAALGSSGEISLSAVAASCAAHDFIAIEPEPSWTVTRSTDSASPVTGSSRERARTVRLREVHIL